MSAYFARNKELSGLEYRKWYSWKTN